MDLLLVLSSLFFCELQMTKPVQETACWLCEDCHAIQEVHKRFF